MCASPADEEAAGSAAEEEEEKAPSLPCCSSARIRATGPDSEYLRVEFSVRMAHRTHIKYRVRFTVLPSASTYLRHQQQQQQQQQQQRCRQPNRTNFGQSEV